MNQRIKLHALSVSLVALSSGWVNAAEVNLYTTREPVLIQPLLEEFNQKTGIKVNTVSSKMECWNVLKLKVAAHLQTSC